MNTDIIESLQYIGIAWGVIALIIFVFAPIYCYSNGSRGFWAILSESFFIAISWPVWCGGHVLNALD